MSLMESLGVAARALGLVAGLIVPGTFILRALRLPWSLAAAFASSTAALYVVVLAFTFAGIRISGGTLAIALAVVAVGAAFIPTHVSATKQPGSFAGVAQLGGWLPLYAAFWAIVTYRLATQPLTGPDVYFRWSYLAEQMLRYGTLDFYPPRSASDYVRYFWPESIPPGVASLYAWAYGSGGTKHALWTSPVVALQLWSTHEIIWRIALRWGGEVPGRRALLLAAACPLLTWSFVIGQETGLTALGVAGLVWCLQHARERTGRPWIILAAIFAIVAASTREYGPVFAALGLLAAVFLRLPRGRLAWFAVIALPVVLAWPLRTWRLTGNPFYSLDLNGYFPVNPVFNAWSRAFHESVSTALTQWGDWQAVGRYALLWALPAVVGTGVLVWLLATKFREARLASVFIVVTAALWALSVGHTAGGLFYSMRVLSPAFALLVVAAAHGSAQLVAPAWVRGALVVLLLAVGLESLPKTLALPENPYRLPPEKWTTAGREFSDSVRAMEQRVALGIATLPDGNRRILTDNAGLPRALAGIGVVAVPFWSPECAWLFSADRSPEEVGISWKKGGYHYIALGRDTAATEYVRVNAGWRAPIFTITPVLEIDSLVILRASATASSPAGH